MATMEKTQVQEMEAQETTKWDIKVYHRRKSGDYTIDVKTQRDGSILGEVFTDSTEIPKRIVSGERKYMLTYSKASYIVYKLGKNVIMLVDTSKDVEIKTDDEDLDDVLNELKIPEEAKFEKDPKRAFAERCSQMAKECQVPFEIAMSFGGSKKEILRFKQSFEVAVKCGKFSEKILQCFKKDISEIEAQTLLMLLKIYTGESKTCTRIAKTVYRMATSEKAA